ncbi:uncharacterized protein LOC123311854 [Coccinella septempunctata]|uniref:uncharacterized protein LOC123311854 n=1 Tax=Coccinella septempunctata TaxID=41139 RepID=UPI001D077457|nr:uncharacterized protein LOC123311854 [Coccinella septempunctata]
MQNQYLDLRYRITHGPENQMALEELKSQYRDLIHSNRAYDRIRTLSDLITVLEKRDVLNEYNMGRMRDIENILSVYIPTAYRRSRSSTTPFCPHPDDMHSTTPSRIECNPIVKAKVYKTIATTIGRKWAEFGRELSVPENEIDYLSHKDTKDRIYYILRYHEENCDPRRWKTKLLSALIECRRKDIYETVQSYFDTYI